jgi:hypothetical protein
MRRFQIGNNGVEEQSAGFRQSLVVAYRSKLRRSVFARRLERRADFVNPPIELSR